MYCAYPAVFRRNQVEHLWGQRHRKAHHAGKGNHHGLFGQRTASNGGKVFCRALEKSRTAKTAALPTGSGRPMRGTCCARGQFQRLRGPSPRCTQQLIFRLWRTQHLFLFFFSSHKGEGRMVPETKDNISQHHRSSFSLQFFALCHTTSCDFLQPPPTCALLKSSPAPLFFV